MNVVAVVIPPRNNLSSLSINDQLSKRTRRLAQSSSLAREVFDRAVELNGEQRLAVR